MDESDLQRDEVAIIKVFVKYIYIYIYIYVNLVKVQMKCFFLFPNLKEQQKSGRLPFTVS